MRRRSRLFLGVTGLIALTTLVSVQLLRGGINGPRTFSGERALGDVVTQVAFGPRTPGSAGHADFVAWAQTQFEDAGWQVEIQRVGEGGEIQNIVATRESLADEKSWLIIGAHYDTRLLADQDSDPANRGQPGPGANDGASGVAVLLELARVLPDLPDKNIWLVLFDGEDNGEIDGREWALGSAGFVAGLPELSGGRLPAGVVIIDMIGDADLNIHLETNSNTALSAAIWSAAARQGHAGQIIPLPKYSMLDDHTAFLQADIPAALLIDFDYPYWHTLGDTPDKLSAASLFAVGDTLLAWLVGGE